MRVKPADAIELEAECMRHAAVVNIAAANCHSQDWNEALVGASPCSSDMTLTAVHFIWAPLRGMHGHESS